MNVRQYLIAFLGIATALASMNTVAAGDPDAGQAASAVCATCHGQDGATPSDPSYPNLAGQNEKYLLRQLQKIQSGDRQIPLMMGQLDGKDEQQLADLAAYYASQQFGVLLCFYQTKSELF